VRRCETPGELERSSIHALREGARRYYASVEVLRTRASTAVQLNDGMGQLALTMAGVSRTKGRTLIHV
jgi:hypothetical protein